MKSTPPEFIEIEFIQVSADKGVSSGNAFRDAIILAATEWKNINLIFNGKTYRIGPNDLYASVKEIGKESPVPVLGFKEAIMKMADVAHDAVAYVGKANYGEREAEAHEKIYYMQKELLG